MKIRLRGYICGLVFLTLVATGGSMARAQDQAAGGGPTPQDALHLNTIGAFSAGFVIQSYGYIGILADTMTKGVYEPELVRSMLAETISYLNNISGQLNHYQSGAPGMGPGDRKFIVNVNDSIRLLIAEAEALSEFSKTKSKEDLNRFNQVRDKAWSHIKSTFDMN